MIIIKQIGTGLTETLSVDDSTDGEINIFLCKKKEPKTFFDAFGRFLIAPDISIIVDLDGLSSEYLLYVQGQLLCDGDNIYEFEYGSRWYTLMEDKLRSLLKENPRYFLDEH
jgi:hypothetical protein